MSTAAALKCNACSCSCGVSGSKQKVREAVRRIVLVLGRYKAAQLHEDEARFSLIASALRQGYQIIVMPHFGSYRLI